MGLDLNLTTELMLKLVLDELVLEEDLETDDKFALLFAGQIDATKLTSAKLLADIEILETPALGRLGFDRSRDLASSGSND